MPNTKYMTLVSPSVKAIYRNLGEPFSHTASGCLNNNLTA